MKCLDRVRERAALFARRVWWGVAAATVAITAASFAIQPHLSQRFGQAPWGFVFPVIAVAGLLGVFLCKTPQTELLAFLSSCGYLVGMMTSAAFGFYPLLLPASTNPALSLTIDNTAAGSYGLHTGLAWWIPGMLLATAYAIFTYRRLWGKLSLE
jgi:cytochrome d ubiquinol oxidase subunit II